MNRESSFARGDQRVANIQKAEQQFYFHKQAQHNNAGLNGITRKSQHKQAAIVTCQTHGDCERIYQRSCNA